MISKFKAIVFDWDGTLVDTCGLILDAHNHVRDYMGHARWTMDDFLGQASKSAREYYPEVYGARADEAQKVLYDYVLEHHLTYLKPMDQALELLEYLSQSGVPLGVVSNKRHDTLHIEIEAMQFKPFFKSIVGAGHAPKDKPSPEPLLMALTEMDKNLVAADILYVGDTETDLMTARNAGAPIAFLQVDRPRPDLIEKYHPEWQWDNLSSFFAAIRGQSRESA